MEEIRLQKYLADAGLMSRRAAEREISRGAVRVNGAIAEIGQKIVPDVDTVEYNGKEVPLYDLLEDEINETPCNWLWSHKRWK